MKLLLFLDVGGSMDPYVRLCEELFSAARSEFKHLDYHYFHNCPYDWAWKDGRRRWSERIAVMDLIHRYPADYRLLFVGDAAMSPHELMQRGGAGEHSNAQSGEQWIRLMTGHWRAAAWLNPIPEHDWHRTRSIAMVRETMEGRMFPLTLDGLDRAMRCLSRNGA